MRSRWLLLGVLLTLVASIRWTSRKGAAWSPTRGSKTRDMFEMIELKPGGFIYDLGSGDGRVLIKAARTYRARGVGIEVDPLRYLWSRVRVGLAGLQGRVRIRHGDFFEQDLSDADVVFCYLRQDTNDRLEEKLLRELRPGARVLSNWYTFSGLEPIVEDRKAHEYAYQVSGD